ncbi:molybdenum cofactor guanylyltransferase [Bacillus pinisoli]|uniref:molybdenum cofactor guanylyltransferase n=1 Tax=Bacillus pinisoli TaxID=2901866 RepID=UPI001FF2F605|nr:molybdenum cofactor guanylyltransferase [Bacillus pinisoli]
MTENVAGIILSGGESRRFGTPKAFADYKGNSFWKYSYHSLRNVTDSQLIVSHEALVERFKKETELPIILDDPTVRGKGPMAGIYSGMKSLNADWYIVVSCDIPAITEEVIAKIMTYRAYSIQAVVPVINERYQPLVALYHSTVFPVIESLLLNNQFRVTSLLDTVETLYVTEKELQIDPTYFQNVNDLEAYQELVNDTHLD